MPKKLKQKKAQINKREFMYKVDKVFDSETSSGTFTNTGYTCDTNWVITDAPKTIGEEVKKTEKAFTDFRVSFKGASNRDINKEKRGVKFCQTCGNMYEEGLDDNFCNAECKYKYCEIEDEADKHSE